MKNIATNFAKGLLILTALTASLAHAGQGGNGGAGVNINGRLKTFYSAGFYVEPIEATTDEVPQLGALINFFSSSSYMSELTKVQFVQALVPSSARNYYKVQQNTFTPEVRARLIAKYGEIMHVNTSEIAIFAITDQTSSTTYLFPEFYSLTPIEQQAILFHEAYWIVHPNATYEQVIQAEMALQGYLENPNSSERALRWIKSVGKPGDVLLATIRSDLKSGAMKGLVSGEKMSLVNLLGNQFFDCQAHGFGPECVSFVKTHAYELTVKYPRSLFLKLFYESLTENHLIFKSNYEYYTKYSTLDQNFGEWQLKAARSVMLNLSSNSYGGSTKLTTNSIGSEKICWEVQLNGTTN